MLAGREGEARAAGRVQLGRGAAGMAVGVQPGRLGVQLGWLGVAVGAAEGAAGGLQLGQLGRCSWGGWVAKGAVGGWNRAAGGGVCSWVCFQGTPGLGSLTGSTAEPPPGGTLEVVAAAASSVFSALCRCSPPGGRLALARELHSVLQRPCSLLQSLASHSEWSGINHCDILTTAGLVENVGTALSGFCCGRAISSRREGGGRRCRPPGQRLGR